MLAATLTSLKSSPSPGGLLRGHPSSAGHPALTGFGAPNVSTINNLLLSLGTRQPSAICFCGFSWLYLPAAPLAPGSVAPGHVRPRMSVCVQVRVSIKGTGSVLFTERATDAAASSLSLSSPLILLLPSELGILRREP